MRPAAPENEDPFDLVLAGDFLPSGAGGYAVATNGELAEIRARIGRGLEEGALEEGALGVGMGIQYTPGTTRWEILELFREAADHRAPVFAHVRGFGSEEPGGNVESFLEVMGAVALTGAPLHLAHLNSMSLEETRRTRPWPTSNGRPRENASTGKASSATGRKAAR